MREKEVEQYLRDKVKELGGRAFKFVSPGNDGVPDRLVVLPGNCVFFVETKATGKTSTPLQKKTAGEAACAGLLCIYGRR